MYVKENGQQFRREILCKKLQKVLRSLHLGVDFVGKKTDGAVTSGWEPVARVVVTDFVLFRFEWSAAALANLGINPEIVAAKLDAEEARTVTNWV